MADRVIRLVLTGSSAGAIHAMEEVDRASGKTSKTLEEHGKRGAHSVDLITSAHHRLRSVIGSTAGILGLGGLAFGIRDVVKAGMGWQAQQAQLQQALRATHLYTKQNQQDLADSAEKVATHGGFDATETLGGLNQFIRLTHSVTKAQQLNTEATNIARATNVSYATAIRMVSQIQTGNTGRLQRYIGILQPVKTHVDALANAHKLNAFQMDLQAKAMGKAGPMWLKQQALLHGINPLALQHAQLLDKQATAAKANAMIMQKYGGATSAFSHTTAGAINNAKNAIDVAIKTVGVAVLPVVAKIATGFANVVTGVVRDWPKIRATIVGVFDSIKPSAQAVLNVIKGVVGWLEKHKTVALALGVALGTLVAGFVAFRTALMIQGLIEGVSGAIVALGISMDALPFVAIAAAIALLVGGLVALYVHSQKFREIVQGVFGFVKTFVTNVIHGVVTEFQGIVQAFKGVWEIIKGVFTLNANEVWKGVKDIFGGWINTIKGMILTISAPFRTAFKYVKQFVQPVIDWLINALKWIIDKVTWLPRQIAKLNPFSGGNSLSPQTTHGVAAAGGFRGHAQAGRGSQVPAGSNGPIPPGGVFGGIIHNHVINNGDRARIRPTDSNPQSAHANTGFRTGDIVLHHQSLLNGRVIAEETTRYQNQMAARR